MINCFKYFLIICLYHFYLFAHCQVPCGIYSDTMQISQIREDLDTIEKAMEQIVKLSSKNDPQSINQIIRWTNLRKRMLKIFQILLLIIT